MSFLVGDALSLADVEVAGALLPLYEMVLDDNFRSSFPHTNEWFDAVCKALPALGPVELCVKMQTAPRHEDD